MKNFVKVNHPEWCNLQIYPEYGVLLKEIGLLNDISEMYTLERKTLSLEISSKHSVLIKRSTVNFSDFSPNLLVYLEKQCAKETTTLVADILIGPPGMDNFYKSVPFGDKTIYFSKESWELFVKHFGVYFVGNSFVYDNLICLAMIVKDSGPDFENVLRENLPFFDRWCILDTGSTDGTQETIKRVLKDKKGTLYNEPFVNFRDSRNRCLELAGHTCQFICTLDDTYALKGNIRKFLTEVRGDTFADSFSLMIQSNDSEYYSNRVIKSCTGLRYIHTIHEVITQENNINVTVPFDQAYILDHRSEYMEKRTNDRKQFDLELLFKELEQTPDDPRTLYYIAQTYGCIDDEINRVKYFELRIKQDGYIQEKIDALFELARCYNFKVHPETLKLIKPGQKLSEKHWKRCHDLYLQAHLLDRNRPDSLYFIGIHYYLEKDIAKAYSYFKKAFEIGYPIHSQYSLKPTISYHFLPKFLAEICYSVDDYRLGLQATRLFLSKNKESGNYWNLMCSWYNIHKQLDVMPSLVKYPIDDKNIFCIVTDGGWEPWTGRDIETKGLGGSETWVIETARCLQQDFNVVVFCNTKVSEIYDGVGYNPVELFAEFISKNVVEYCVISRYTEYIPVALKGYAKNVSVILHDLLSPELVIPVHPKLKCMFGLTEWHQEHIKAQFPHSIKYNHYGINEIQETKKIAGSFIYSSFPNRGLVVLLQMWPEIKQILPHATLNVYCDLEHPWTNKFYPKMMKTIKGLIHQENVVLHGWVSKKDLNLAWAQTEYWLYPCIFEETFCLTALEAAISKTLVITNGLAGLSETAKHGVVIEGDPITPEWQSRCLAKLKNLSDKFKESIIFKNYNWAKTLSWKSQTSKLLDKLKLSR